MPDKVRLSCLSGTGCLTFDCRNRNLRQFRVRGLAKTKAVALWHALAFNLRRMIDLGVLAT